METGLTGDQVLTFTFALLSILLNGVLLASMYKERKKIFVTRISCLVANLAVADFLNGLVALLLVQPIDEIQFHSDTRRLVTLPLVWIAFCASFFTLFLMAAERLVVVKLPMVWSSLLTIPRTVVCICLVWFLSAGVGAAIHYNQYYAQLVICFLVEVIALSFIAIHVYILWILRQREKCRDVARSDPSQSTPCLETPRNENIAHRKVTIVVTILLFVLIVTIVPYFVCLQMFAIQNTFDNTVREKIDLQVFYKVFKYTDSFTYLNFLSNPIIYAWRLRMYRKAFLSLLGQGNS
jgi:hypothetical protein